MKNKCQNCGCEIASQGLEQQPITPPNFQPTILYFHNKGCQDQWEGSDKQKDYDLKRLKALEEVNGKPQSDHENADKWDFTDEIKTIRTKWNLPEFKENSPNKDDKGIGAGGIVVIIAIILAIAAGIGLWWWYKNKQNRAEDAEL